MKRKNAPQTSNPVSLNDQAFFTRHEAAAFARVSYHTIREWEYQGKLPAMKPSSRLTIYRREDIIAAMGPVITREPIAA
ncbi:MAG: helix-turn-helix domain-containing protein [Verrucomicrobiales bacterium]